MSHLMKRVHHFRSGLSVGRIRVRGPKARPNAGGGRHAGFRHASTASVGAIADELVSNHLPLLLTRPGVTAPGIKLSSILVEQWNVYGKRHSDAAMIFNSRLRAEIRVSVHTPPCGKPAENPAGWIAKPSRLWPGQVTPSSAGACACERGDVETDEQPVVRPGPATTTRSDQIQTRATRPRPSRLPTLREFRRWRPLCTTSGIPETILKGNCSRPSPCAHPSVAAH